jgi:hypothetical protein
MPSRVDDVGGRGGAEVADRFDAPVADADISAPSRRAGAIDE